MTANAAAGLGMVLAALILPSSAHADEAGEDVQRIRITLGPELGPAYPGADRSTFSPFFDFSSASGDEVHAYEAPDESFGFPLIRAGDVYIGPTLAITDRRGTDDTTPGLRTIDTTFEAGVSVAINIAPSLYAFTEVRRGIGGHDGWTGVAGVDYIMRSGDDWLVSLGPRVNWGDGKHARSYFGVTPVESMATGLPAFDPDGGIESMGATLGALYQINDRWGLAAYGNYARMVGDAANSPVVRQFGSRNQWAGGIALSYTFKRRK